jgi:outer membrane protein OmpA-like peptidoglycan-associated protein
MDSNGTMDQYMDYSVKLAKTLGTFSPAALYRILGEYAASAADGASLNDELSLEAINFEYGSPKLSPSAFEELDKVAKYLQDNPGV